MRGRSKAAGGVQMALHMSKLVVVVGFMRRMMGGDERDSLILLPPPPAAESTSYTAFALIRLGHSSSRNAAQTNKGR
jgi:hypothetical protein